MENRNFSDFSRTQLLGLLERLQGDIDRGQLPLQTDPRLQQPSRLEAAVSRRLAELAAQNRLAPHPQLLAAIVEACEDAISSRRLDGTILTWNKGSERIYDYTEQEVLGRNHLMLFPDANTAELESINQRLAHGEAIREHESV